jgi:uncharacterized membrane protein
MDTTLMRTVTLATALGTGVLGGVFVGFSTFVMPALDRLAAADAVRAMQAMNVTAPRGLAVPLAVSGLGSLAVGGWALARSSGSARALLVAGALTGVVALGVTAAYHVPRNDALDRVDAGSAAAATAWQAYAPGWVAMNHVRAVLSLASAGLLVAGAVKSG